jgi:hypothetical protein
VLRRWRTRHDRQQRIRPTCAGRRRPRRRRWPGRDRVDRLGRGRIRQRTMGTIRRGAENDEGQQRNQDQNPSGPSAATSRSLPDFEDLVLIIRHTTMKSPLVPLRSAVRPVFDQRRSTLAAYRAVALWAGKPCCKRAGGAWTGSCSTDLRNGRASRRGTSLFRHSSVRRWQTLVSSGKCRETKSQVRAGLGTCAYRIQLAWNTSTPSAVAPRNSG